MALDILNKRLSLLLLGGEFVGAIKFRKGRGHCGFMARAAKRGTWRRLQSARSHGLLWEQVDGQHQEERAQNCAFA